MPRSNEHPQISDNTCDAGSPGSARIRKADDPSAITVLGSRIITTLVFSIWGLAIVIGSAYGLWYETTPTATNSVSERWPVESSCLLSLDRPTLLMFVHPRCPCSRSSLNELAVLMAHCKERVDAQVLFYKPQSTHEDWANTDLWQSATRIPGVVPRLDVAGIEHRRFGARVSGEVIVFSPSGELLFHGGITAARGHSGDNQGRSALESILLHHRSTIRSTPVFGCELETSF